MSDYFYAGGGIGLGPGAPVLEREPYPAPEVDSRDGLEVPDKTSITTLIHILGPWGFEIRTRYARGHFPHSAHGTPGPLMDSIGLVALRGQVRGVAVYAGSAKAWSWTTLAVQHGSGFQTRFLTVEAFLARLLGPIHQPIRAASPMEGPARRALKVHGPLMP
jgi:hypothetical protein